MWTSQRLAWQYAQVETGTNYRLRSRYSKCLAACTVVRISGLPEKMTIEYRYHKRMGWDLPGAKDETAWVAMGDARVKAHNS